ncbi:MAG TPA: hypothetical protein VIK89_03045 [Cytophagaceae bacterium]
MNIDELNDVESNRPVNLTMKILNLIFLALLLGQFAFAAVIFFIHYSQELPGDKAIHLIMQYAVPLVAVTSIGLTKILHDKIISSIGTNTGITDKLSKYKTASIIRLFGLEASNIFTLVAYLLTGQTYYLYFFGIIIVLFLMAKPSRFKFHELLGE